MAISNKILFHGLFLSNLACPELQIRKCSVTMNNFLQLSAEVFQIARQTQKIAIYIQCAANLVFGRVPENYPISISYRFGFQAFKVLDLFPTTQSERRVATTNILVTEVSDCFKISLSHTTIIAQFCLLLSMFPMLAQSSRLHQSARRRHSLLEIAENKLLFDIS